MEMNKPCDKPSSEDSNGPKYILGETNFPSRVFASILIGLSGIILYLDKLFYHIGFAVEIPEKFSTAGMPFETFVWLWAQTLSPLLLIIGGLLRPYKYVYLIPLFCYLLQAYTLAFDSQDFTYTGFYAIGMTLLVFFDHKMIKKYFRRSLQQELEEMKEEVLKISRMYISKLKKVSLLLKSAKDLYHNGKSRKLIYGF